MKFKWQMIAGCLALSYLAGCAGMHTGTVSGRSPASVGEPPLPEASTLVGEYSGFTSLGNTCHVSIVRDEQSQNGDSLSVAISFQPSGQSKIVPGPERVYGVNIATLNKEIASSDAWHKDPKNGDKDYDRSFVTVGYDDDPAMGYTKFRSDNTAGWLVSFDWFQGQAHDVEIGGSLHSADMQCMLGAHR